MMDSLYWMDNLSCFSYYMVLVSHTVQLAASQYHGQSFFPKTINAWNGLAFTESL